MTIVPFPAGKGSAEQWVRMRFAKEVAAYRHRSARAKTALIVMIDADSHKVAGRLAELAQSLEEAGSPPVQMDEKIAQLVPKRNVETWILCLTGEEINEETDYKGTRQDWTNLIPQAAITLFQWTRPNTAAPEDCIDSLTKGITELRRLED